MGNPRCKWVRDRLPLLAGGELVGTERRRVERHLIGCPQCRSHRVALAHALGVLHAAAAETPSSAGASASASASASAGASASAPSLWPAVARQIRESHRPASASAFTWSPWSVILRPRFGPALGLSLGLIVALGVTWSARQQSHVARVKILAARLPIAPPPPSLRPLRPLRPLAPVAPAVAGARQLAQAEPAPEPAPAARYDFDLEHGTPMNPDAAEGKSTSRPTY